MGWRDLSEHEKLAFYKRWQDGERVSGLAREAGLNKTALLQNLKNLGKRITQDLQLDADILDAPPAEELFTLLKARPYSILELCNKYDRSPATVRSWIAAMQEDGFVVSEQDDFVSFEGGLRPTVDYKPERTLADEHGQMIAFAVCSDLHGGSSHSQPTNHKKFLDIAYEEYGVRVVFDPGDKTTGVNGYRGQEHDLVPALRLAGARSTLPVTEQQIWLADKYTPRYPSLKYYMLGGNHDYWHVVNSGVDAVARLCKQRDDMVYLGYDVADVPLTDRVDVRMWHPSGGVPYAMSYRLQKAMEQTAFEELTRAATENDNPRLRILLAGHMHIEVKVSRGPMTAAHVGCFEGQTNYLKRKGLFPQIGGAIFRVWLTDSGLIQRTEYTFIPFNEIQDDWKSWPVPSASSILQQPDDLNVLFQASIN